MESQQPAWQRHLLLIVGIGLPFALMAFVLIYQSVVVAHVPLPRYAAVYAITNPDNIYSPGNFDSRIINGQLDVTYTPPLPNNSPANPPTTPLVRLYILRDLDRPEMYDLSPPPDAKEKTPVALPAPLQVRMISGDTAPDGYRYLYDYGGYNGFMTEIFMGESRNYQDRYVIHKNGRAFPLLKNENRWPNIRFLGWVEQPVRP